MKNTLLHTVFLILMGLFCAVHTVHATEIQTKAKQAIVVDYDTGAVLLAHNADEQMPTSSMSKVMSMYMVFEALQNQSLSLEDKFVISEKAWRKKGSKMFIEVGKSVKVEDLVRGVIIQSGNDAAIALAEGLAGDELSFAAAMNDKARSLGMDSSNFMNASGWPDKNHYSTARDLATLAKNMIENFPEYYGYYSETEFSYNDISQRNRNPLLYKDIGADGLKTGHTDAGGYGLIGTGKRGDRRVILVVNGLESSKARAEESAKLLQWGLHSFRNVQFFSEEVEIDRIPVVLGERKYVGVQAKSSIKTTIPRLYMNKLKAEVKYKTPLKAPLKKGEEVGEVIVTFPNGTIEVVPLVTVSGVAEQSFVTKIISKARLWTTGQGRML